MNTSKKSRKDWSAPAIRKLTIKKDTFSGSGTSSEGTSSSGQKFPGSTGLSRPR